MNQFFQTLNIFLLEICIFLAGKSHLQCSLDKCEMQGLGKSFAYTEFSLIASVGASAFLRQGLFTSLAYKEFSLISISLTPCERCIVGKFGKLNIVYKGFCYIRKVILKFQNFYVYGATIQIQSNLRGILLSLF